MAGIRVAQNAAQADRFWNACRGKLVLGGSAGIEQRPSLDFDEYRLIYLHMGARQTGGFTLDLAGDEAEVLNQSLIIPVVWQMPPEDGLVPQVLTHPCLLLAVPRGAYKRIEVVDQGARTRLSFTLDAPSP
jgi:hypothetical protein